jgi:hypothetical protein
MTIAAAVANVLLFFVALVRLWTAGPSQRGAHVTLSAVMLVVPVLSAVAILRGGPKDWLRSRVKAVAAAANVVLLGFLFWATVISFPYPEGNGILGFAAVYVVAPVLTLLVLLRPGKSLTQAR